jgi:hypothetical protein
MYRPRGPRPAPRLAPRLVIVFAVLACVFGWGHSASVAASSKAGPTHAVVDASEAQYPVGGHSGHGHPSAESRERGDAHGSGHPPGHEHSTLCMASSAVPALGLATVPDVTALLVTMAPPARLSVVDAGLGEQRGPEIATFCVLRT